MADTNNYKKIGPILIVLVKSKQDAIIQRYVIRKRPKRCPVNVINVFEILPIKCPTNINYLTEKPDLSVPHEMLVKHITYRMVECL